MSSCAKREAYAVIWTWKICKEQMTNMGLRRKGQIFFYQSFLHLKGKKCLIPESCKTINMDILWRCMFLSKKAIAFFVTDNYIWSLLLIVPTEAVAAIAIGCCVVFLAILYCCVRRWWKKRGKNKGADQKKGLKGVVDLKSVQVLGNTMKDKVRTRLLTHKFYRSNETWKRTRVQRPLAHIQRPKFMHVRACVLGVLMNLTFRYAFVL